MTPTEESKAFVAPEVMLGDIVYWKHSPSDGEEAAATVVKVGHAGAISVMVHAPDSVRAIPKDGVIHRHDPRVRSRETDSGVWYHTARTNRVKSLIDLIRELDGKVDVLTERLAAAERELRGEPVAS